jgi:glycerol-3-phosphate acyltransferase PlsY
MSASADWSLLLAGLAALAIGYLLGSIPFGLLLTKLFGRGDLRSLGSGNIGATNVLRTGRKGLAALTLLLDLLKGTAGVAAGALWGPDAALLGGVGAILGHIFPVWLRFHGGKGVATYMGVLVGLAWPAALAFGAVWFATALATRYSSLAALVASATSPCVLAWLGEWRLAGVFLLLAALLFWQHRSNIERLSKGEETRIGESKA